MFYELRKNKMFSLALAIMFAMTIVMPFVAATPAEANTTYSRVTNPTPFDPGNVSASGIPLAQVRVQIDPALAISPTQNVAYMELVDADGSTIPFTVSALVYENYGTTGEGIVIADSTGERKIWKLTLPDPVASGEKAWVTLSGQITQADAQDIASGDVNLRFFNPGGQLVSGEILVARASTGAVQVTVPSVKSFGDGGATVTLRLSETVRGGLKGHTESLKLRLPSGFEWATSGHSFNNITHATNGDTVSFIADDRDLTLNVAKGANTARALIDINVELDVDPTVAKLGEVKVRLSGESDVTPAEVVVGTYGDYEVKVTEVSSEDVQPGQFEQEIGKWALEEALPGTLIKDRTIMLTLPEKAKWDGEYPVFDYAASTGSITLSDWTLVGTDDRVIRATVNAISSGNKATKLVFKDGKITVAGDFVGDVKLAVSGSAGANGEAKVATAKAPITATTAELPNMIIGVRGQAAADVTITESAAEVLKHKDFFEDEGYLVIETPVGVRFASAPTFTVTDGDVMLGTVVTESDWSQAWVRVRSTSSDASTIKISNIKLIVDRTVPEGDIQLKIGGNALIENDTDDFFPNVMWATRVTVGNTATPAPVETKVNAEFVIGSTTYKVNDVEQTMDVAPYVKDGRTYLPVRYVANALGVDNNNIMWDSATGTVTMIKGDKVVQVAVGSKNMVINGATIAMDAAPEITNGRTMLPFRWIAWAFGANVEWDAATQTVTIN